MSNKVFVEVTAKHDLYGNVRPLSIKWKDGRVFEVDRLLDVRQAPSLKCGGLGIRYTCMIMSKQIYLFDDEGQVVYGAKCTCDKKIDTI